MKIAVCGDSFSSETSLAPNTHWSEILQQKFQCELINLAMIGTSNSHIRLQIQTAMSLKPDFVIINSTTTPRIEFPLKKTNHKRQKYKLADFNNKVKVKPKMIAFTAMMIIEENRKKSFDISDETADAVLKYMLHLYDEKWQRQKDQWLITGGLWGLYNNNIPFMYDPWLLDKGWRGNLSEVPDEMPSWFKEKYYISYSDSFSNLYQTYKLEQKEDPGYHLNVHAQQIIANNYYNRIVKMIDIAKII